MNNFLHSSLNRPISSIMIITSAILFGSISLYKLDISLLPTIKRPGLTILLRYTDISAEKMEEIAVIPVERSISGVQDIKEIFSQSKRGEGRVHLIFSSETNLKTRIMEVSEIVNRIKLNFPREMEPPSIIPYDPENKPIFIASIELKDKTVDELRPYVESKIKPSLEKISGVSEVFISGGSLKEIIIGIDPGILTQSNISLSQIQTTISKLNYETLVGYIDGSSVTGIIFNNKLTNWQDINSESINNTKNVSIESIALVKQKLKEKDSISRINGKSKISIYVYKSGIANTAQISHSLRKYFKSIENENLKFDILYDQGDDIRSAIKKIVLDMILGSILATVIVYLFNQNIFQTFLIISAIPLTLISSMFILYLFNFNINIMNLSGLTIAAGMTVDSSIIVADRINFIHSTQNQSIIESIKRSIPGLYSPLIASFLMQTVVFLPVFFLDYESRAMLLDFSAAMVTVILLSLIYSIFFLPIFIQFTNTNKASSPEKFKIDYFLNNARSIINSLSLWSLNKRKHVFISMIVLILLGLFSFYSIEKRVKSSMPSLQLEGQVSYDPGLSLYSSNILIKEIESVLQNKWFTDRVTSNVKKDSASINLKIKEDAISEQDIETIKGSLEKESTMFPEVYISWTEAGESTGNNSLVLNFYNENYKILREKIDETSKELKNKFPFISSIVYKYRKERTDLSLLPSNPSLALSGTTGLAYGENLKTLHRGNVLNKYFDGTKEQDVRLTGEDFKKKNPDEILFEYVYDESGLLSNSELIKLEKSNNESNIYRKNKRRMLSLELKLSDVNLVTASNQIENFLIHKYNNSSTSFEMDENIFKIKKLKDDMTFAILLAVTIEYLILGFLFNSKIKPLIVMSIIPVVLSAAVILLFIFKTKLTIGVYFGLMMLSGFIINSSVLLVSSIEENLESFSNISTAIQKAITERSKPIIMSVITSIAGMLPLTLDSSRESLLWKPLSTTVILGLIISTITVFIIISSVMGYQFKWTGKENGKQ